MASSFSVSIPPAKPLLLYVGVVLVLGVYSYFLPHIIWDINTFGGLFLLPYLIIFYPKAQKTKISWRFGVLSALFLCLAFALPRQNSPLFFSLCFALFFLVENLLGKITLFSLWTIGLVSPLLRYVGTSLSFPIRLEITTLAGKFLSIIFNDVNVVGNIITLNGQEFSVDPACVGLKMIGTSLMVALLFMAYFQRLTQKIIPFWWSCVLILCVMLLNIINNLLRIMILVVFRVMPETPLHDILGLLSLIMYVILPFYFIVKYSMSLRLHVPFFNKQINLSPYSLQYDIHLEKHNAIKSIFSAQLFTWWLFVLLSIGICVQGYRLSQKIDSADSVNVDLKGYHKEVLANGTLKFTTPEVLVYVKPLAGFHSAEHSPLFCWQGSGYSFQHNKKVIVNQQEIYIGKLTKEQEVLYTAWWFSNGKYHTLNPFAWRWQSLQGQKDFYLMNVSTADEATLLIEVKKLIP